MIKKIIKGAMLIMPLYLNSLTTREFVMEYSAPSLVKYTIASEFNPDTNFINLNDTIRLYKQIISKDTNKELVRISHYNLSELYYQIYFSNENQIKYKKYKDYAITEFQLALYMATDKVNFNSFIINNKRIERELPPKFILDDYLYLAPIKLLYYFYYKGLKTNAEFEINATKSNIYLNQLLNMNYEYAYTYKLKEYLKQLESPLINLRKNNDLISSINWYKKGEKLLRTSKINKVYAEFLEMKSVMQKINRLYIEKIDKLINNSNNNENYINKKENWINKYSTIEFNLYKPSKKTQEALKRFSEPYSEASIKKYRKEMEKKNEKYKIKRMKILNETGHDINDDNLFLKSMKKMKETGKIF